jgi:predicted ATPase/DNA-binding winged helix-turn-helix (wHTH) protein
MRQCAQRFATSRQELVGFWSAPAARTRIGGVTTPPEPQGKRLTFDDFELDVANARLLRAGTMVELAPKSFALLVFLAQRPGELVLKDTLLDTVWGRRFVSEGAVKTVVSELRAALGDDARAPRWIETVQRRGYRFLGAVTAVSGTVPAAAPTRRGNLPAAAPELVGREAELLNLHQLLAAERLVTVCGPAGVGKTSLALAAARRGQHAGGVWLAELAPLPAEATQAADLCATLARALQMPPTGMRSGNDLAQALQGLPLLLVVDNAEHLLEALAPLVAQLLRELPQLQWLVTSREPLQIPGEQVLRLAPLSLPPPGADDDVDPLAASGAMRLFVQRVAARLPGFAPGPGQRRAVAQVCRALDGLPLALELAAARVPVLGMHGLAAHLAADDAGGARLQLLTHASRTAEPHQRTLRSALEWSHALLKPAEQQVFRRLAVFAGGFTLAAAQAVCADGDLDSWAVLHTLEALAEKSMVTAPAQHDDGATPARFTLLQSLREYAAERLAAAGETAATAQRHLAWAQVYWAQADGAALSEPVLAWTARHAPELDNLRAALRWAQASLALAEDPAVADDLLALVGHSAIFWQRAGLLAEGAPWCRAVRERAERHPDPLRRAGIQLALATFCRFMALLPPAEGLLLAQQAAAAYAECGDRVREYFAHYLAWTLALDIGEHVPRARHVVAMQALLQPGWNAMLRRYVRSAWSQDERLQGRFDAFLHSSREDFDTFRQLGAQGESWSAGLGLLLAEHDQGRPAQALAVGALLVDDIRAAGRLRTYAQLLAIHTTMLAESGDAAGTRCLLIEALPMLPTMSACEILHLAMAWLATHEGRDADAARLLGWFDSAQRGGGVYGPHTFTRRTAMALGRRLDERLGVAANTALQAGAADLGDAEALRLGLAADPRTNRKPTAS